MKKALIVYTVFILSILTGFSSEPIVNKADESGASIVLFPIQKATISALIDSDLTKYLFKEGEIFKQGDTLVQMDDSLYKENYNSAKSGLDKAKSAQDFASKIYAQNLDMYKKNGLSMQELEKSKMDNELAKSELEQIQANLKIAEIKLSFCTIKAPFSGRVTKKLKNEHEYVRAGEPIIEVIDDKELLAVMNLPSSEFSNIKLGQKKDFYIDELSKTYSGKVYEVAGDINPGSRTFEVKVLIDNSRHELIAGMSGHLVDK
ncbi:MAG: efflux RND transporter periplasmic adaptor subunit [Lentisphaerota bacterium]